MTKAKSIAVTVSEKESVPNTSLPFVKTLLQQAGIDERQRLYSQVIVSLSGQPKRFIARVSSALPKRPGLGASIGVAQGFILDQPAREIFRGQRLAEEVTLHLLTTRTGKEP